jgi:hypothetical protein
MRIKTWNSGGNAQHIQTGAISFKPLAPFAANFLNGDDVGFTRRPRAAEKAENGTSPAARRFQS